jgi:hypothetical protein
MTLVAGAALALALTGCLEEDRVITLMPDGKHGKMTFERALGGQMAEMMQSMGGGAAGEDAAKEFAASQLASMDGIVAWTDVEASVGEDGKMRVKATGWFEDLGAVAQSGDSSDNSFTVEHGEGTVTVTMQETTGDDEGGDDSLLTQSDEEYAMAKQMTKGMISGMLAGFRMTVKLELPGEVQTVAGFAQEGNTVSVSRNADEILGLIDKMFEIADELRPKVKSGELDATQAEAQMKEKLAESMVYTVTAKLPTGTDATLASFKEELAAAVTAYEGSEWKGAVEQAKAEAAAQAEMELGGDMGDMGDMGEDEGGEMSDADWNERAAVGALKTLATAQSLFREADKDGNNELDYAGDLGALGKADLIDSVLASGTKQGYTFKLVRSKKAPEFLWMAVASPTEAGTSGNRHFAINHEGVVYESDSAFVTNDECKISGGAPVSR